MWSFGNFCIRSSMRLAFTQSLQTIENLPSVPQVCRHLNNSFNQLSNIWRYYFVTLFTVQCVCAWISCITWRQFSYDRWSGRIKMHGGCSFKFLVCLTHGCSVPKRSKMLFVKQSAVGSLKRRCIKILKMFFRSL